MAWHLQIILGHQHNTQGSLNRNKSIATEISKLNLMYFILSYGFFIRPASTDFPSVNVLFAAGSIGPLHYGSAR
jgi:hypothetical protein